MALCVRVEQQLDCLLSVAGVAPREQQDGVLIRNVTLLAVEAVTAEAQRGFEVRLPPRRYGLESVRKQSQHPVGDGRMPVRQNAAVGQQRVILLPRRYPVATLHRCDGQRDPRSRLDVDGGAVDAKRTSLPSRSAASSILAVLGSTPYRRRR